MVLLEQTWSGTVRLHQIKNQLKLCLKEQWSGKLEDGKSSVPKIESARPEGHWVPGRRHHSVNLNPPGTESIVSSPVRPLHGPARSELPVGTWPWPWLADSRVNLNLPARRRGRALSLSYPAAPPPSVPMTQWPHWTVTDWLTGQRKACFSQPRCCCLYPSLYVSVRICTYINVSGCICTYCFLFAKIV